jgi:hypothetical protein
MRIVQKMSMLINIREALLTLSFFLYLTNTYRFPNLGFFADISLYGYCNSHWYILNTEPVFLNVYGAQESIPRNEFRQPS